MQITEKLAPQLGVETKKLSTVTNEVHTFQMYPGYEIGGMTKESCLA